MFKQILYTHVKWTRTMVASMAVLTFLVPALAWWLGATQIWDPANPRAVIAGMETMSPVLSLLAILGAFLLATYPWTIDGASKHVLPLSLPITWPRYVSMRYGAGVLLLLIPSLTLWLGSLLAIAMMTLPPTLRAYPTTLALRFLAGTLLIYSITFLLQYLAGRRSAAMILGLLVGFAVVMFGLQLTGNSYLMTVAVRWLTVFPGPFAVFGAEWKLIDV